jgi:methylated-DNA-[protein]-cysteine S-methyltransferase
MIPDDMIPDDAIPNDRPVPTRTRPSPSGSGWSTARSVLTIAGRNGRVSHLRMDDQRHPPGDREAWEHDPHGFADVAEQLAAYFAGDLTEFTVALDVTGTDFQRRVWAALRLIPYGETWSYGELARHLGNPGASRAVGLANGRNPVGIIVPCHRVVAPTGRSPGTPAAWTASDSCCNWNSTEPSSRSADSGPPPTRTAATRARPGHRAGEEPERHHVCAVCRPPGPEPQRTMQRRTRRWGSAAQRGTAQRNQPASAEGAPREQQRREPDPVTEPARSRNGNYWFLGRSAKRAVLSLLGSLGRPSTRSPMMLRWIWSVPP